MSTEKDSLFDESSVIANDVWLRAAKKDVQENSRIAVHGGTATQEDLYFIPKDMARRVTFQHKE